MITTETIRALSWKEPFASLMLYGKIETRTWPTKYRGLVLICSTEKDYTMNSILNIMGKTLSLAMSVLAAHQINWNLTKGYTIAIGRLIDCRPMEKADEYKCFVKYREPWTEERINKKTGKKKIVKMKLYCHVYEDVRPIRPFLWKGKQGWTMLTHEQKQQIQYL